MHFTSINLNDFWEDVKKQNGQNFAWNYFLFLLTKLLCTGLEFSRFSQKGKKRKDVDRQTDLWYTSSGMEVCFMNKTMILVVEDDYAVRNLITTALETQNYIFHTAENGNQALLEAVSQNPDAILLDLGLPDMDGIEIIKRIRAWSNKPIIVISARTEDRDKIEALDAGADDYLTKPFSVNELLARVRVALRRLSYMKSTAENDTAVFKNGSLTIDYISGCVYLDGEEMHVTPNEYKILCLLAKNVGKVLTHTYITKEIWGGTWESNIASLRVFMAALRKKMEKDTAHPQFIQTHVGVGYRMLRVENDDTEESNKG